MHDRRKRSRYKDTGTMQNAGMLMGPEVHAYTGSDATTRFELTKYRYVLISDPRSRYSRY
jgi:hypothetical protein